jgi:cysteine-rich repeat protein
VEGVCIGESSTCGDGVFRRRCSEECDDGNSSNWDGCNALCRVEGVPRLSVELPWMLEELDRSVRDRQLAPEHVVRLVRTRQHVAKALWWIERPDPVMYPVPPALAELSLALGELEGVKSASPRLAALTSRMLALPRTIAQHRLTVVDCVDRRCQSEVARARRLVKRARGWELRGNLFRAADRYKDAWDWLDGQP